jgi:hypothetical protein
LNVFFSLIGVVTCGWVFNADIIVKRYGKELPPAVYIKEAIIAVQKTIGMGINLQKKVRNELIARKYRA